MQTSIRTTIRRTAAAALLALFAVTGAGLAACGGSPGASDPSPGVAEASPLSGAVFKDLAYGDDVAGPEARHLPAGDR